MDNPYSNESRIKVLYNHGIHHDKNLYILPQYIHLIAFSGAQAFLEQYKDKTNEDQIIGHFGLGFYSAFMVADKVTIDTLSWHLLFQNKSLLA